MDRREKNGNWIMGRKKKYNNNNGKMGEVRNRWTGVVGGCSRWKKIRGTKNEEEKRGQKK